MTDRPQRAVSADCAGAAVPTLASSDVPPTLLELARARWLEGRRKFGPEWHGGPVLDELMQELGDALNYARVAREIGADLGELDALLEQAAALVRKAITDSQHRGLDPLEDRT